MWAPHDCVGWEDNAIQYKYLQDSLYSLQSYITNCHLKTAVE